MGTRNTPTLAELVTTATHGMSLDDAAARTEEAGFPISRDSINKLKKGRPCRAPIMRNFAKAFGLNEQEFLQLGGYAASPNSLASRIREDLQKTARKLEHLSDLVGELEIATTNRKHKKGEADDEKEAERERELVTR